MLVFYQFSILFGGIKNPVCLIPFPKILSIPRFPKALNAPVANAGTTLEMVEVA